MVRFIRVALQRQKAIRGYQTRKDTADFQQELLDKLPEGNQLRLIVILPPALEAYHLFGL
jgi:hypothetical protein